MSRALLEVIALDAADASAAEEGGADRLEVVAGMDQDGLTPTVETVASIRAVSALPLRVMVRARAGFRTDPAEIESLCAAAHGPGRRRCGRPSCSASSTRTATWTWPRCVPSPPPSTCPGPVTAPSTTPATASRRGGSSRDLPGLDTVLTAGSPDGVADGLPNLERHAAEPAGAALILAGGGLRPDLVPGARRDGHHPVPRRHPRRRSWGAPVALVRAWRDAVDAAAS